MMDRDTKLIAILRRQYHIILTALGENIFRIGRSREHVVHKALAVEREDLMLQYVGLQCLVNRIITVYLLVVLPSQNRN